MKYLITILFLILFNSSDAQIKINYWNWERNHTVKNFPEKCNRYDSWNYLPRYYYVPTVSFSLKLKYQKPTNYFYYKENNRKYKFTF